MPFEKGNPKPLNSGTKKGYKKKPTPTRETVAEILANFNVNVIEELLKYTRPESTLADKDKARIFMELMTYVYPKPKAEVDVKVDDPAKNQVMTEMGVKVLEALNKWQASK